MQPVELPFRTAQLYGRESLLQQLRDSFAPGAATQAVLLIGEGGSGKTRVIEELTTELAADGVLFLPIYDFFHIDRFRASAIEEAIIDAFSAQRPQAAALFEPYRERRRRLETTRQSGDAFETAQAEVRKEFVTCYNALIAAEHSRSAVLFFDSVEQAVNLDDGAEKELLGAQSTATPSRGGELWLGSILPQLAGTVAVLSGRPQTLYGQPVALYERLEAAMPCSRILVEGMSRSAADSFAHAIAQLLQNPDTDKEIVELSRSVVLDSATLALWHALSGGQPFWVTMLYTCHMFGAFPPEIDALREKMQGDTVPALSAEDQEQLRGAAMRHFLSEIDANEQGMLLALQWMATIRKGVSVDMLRAIAASEEVELGDIESLHARLAELLVVKRRVVPRYTHAGTTEQETLLFLHDAMYHWLDQNLQGAVFLRPAVSTALLGWYDSAIADATQERLAAVEQLLSLDEKHPDVPLFATQRDEARQRIERLRLDRLGYAYQRDRALGGREYAAQAYQAIVDRAAGYGVMLRQEALRNLYRLDGRVAPEVEVECAARWLLRATHAEDVAQAGQILGRLGPYLEQERALPGPHYALLHLAAAHFLLRFRPEARAQARQELDQARAALEHAPADPWVDLLHAHIDHSTAYAHRLAYDLFDSEAAYRRALQRARRSPLATPELLGNVLQNYAFVISEQGRSEEARRVGLEALAINQRHGSEYSVGLTLNTLARIEIRAGQALLAREYATVAKRIFEQFESERGLSLCLPVLAETHRKVGEQLGHEISRQERTFAYAIELFEQARAILERQQLKGVHSAERWREMYQGMGCAYRSWGQTIHNRGGNPALAADYFSKAHAYLEHAYAEARDKQPNLIKMDIQEDLATVHVNQDEYDERIVRHLDDAEALAPPEYHLVDGKGLRGNPRPVYGFYRELGQCALQRMMLGFGKYDLGLYHYDVRTGERTLLERGRPSHLREAAHHMLLMLAYTIEYAHSSPMLERAAQLTLRELRNGRSEAELKLISTELYEVARRYRLTNSEAMRLAERLIDQADADLELTL